LKAFRIQLKGSREGYKKFGANRPDGYFCVPNEDDYETYKANQEEIPEKGSCLIVLYLKIIEPSRYRGGFLIFKLNQ
jgi:hypothetical protein